MTSISRSARATASRRSVTSSMRIGELVPADARHGVRRSCGALQPLGDASQHQVAVRVPMAVVDVLEAVDVEVDDRDRFRRPGRLGVPLGARHRVLEAIDEERAVVRGP